MKSITTEFDNRPTIYVVTWFYEHQPGIAIYISRLRALESVAKVHLICKSERDLIRLGIPSSQGTVIEVSGESHTDIPNYCWQVVRFLRSQKPGLVVLLASHLSMCSLGLDQTRPTAIYWNEMPVHYFWRARYNKLKGVIPGFLRWLTYLGARKAKIVMPISEFMQQDLINRGRSDESTPIVPMGVFGNPKSIHTANRPQPAESLKLLYSGTLTDERGKNELIEGTLLALKMGAKIHLTLIGLTAESQTSIKNTFKSAGQADKLTTAGVVDHLEVIKNIEQSDIAFSMLHAEEHFQFNPPTKIFEYLAFGTPIIYNKIRTLTAYIKDKETGVMAEPTPKGVADALLWCDNHRHEIHIMREKCKNEGSSYLWEKIAPKFIQATLSAHKK